MRRAAAREKPTAVKQVQRTDQGDVYMRYKVVVTRMQLAERCPVMLVRQS
jgi:hypothetical protein